MSELNVIVNDKVCFHHKLFSDKMLKPHYEKYMNHIYIVDKIFTHDDPEGPHIKLKPFSKGAPEVKGNVEYSYVMKVDYNETN